MRKKTAMGTCRRCKKTDLIFVNGAVFRLGLSIGCKKIESARISPRTNAAKPKATGLPIESEKSTWVRTVSGGLPGLGKRR